MVMHGGTKMGVMIECRTCMMKTMELFLPHQIGLDAWCIGLLLVLKVC